MKKILRLIVLLVLFLNQSGLLIAQKNQTTFYQLTVYHYSTSVQEAVIEQYLEQSLMPALKRIGFEHIGVFKSLANDTVADKQLFVLISHTRLQMIARVEQKLKLDQGYQQSGATYINASFNNPPFNRKEVVLLQSFKDAPLLLLPNLKSPKNERVYELRSYESATEKIFQNKLHMFNEGDEIGLFKELNFNAVFYGEVMAGSKMPNLMYLTCYENMPDREAHWKLFGNHPTWNKLSSMPVYQNNVSHIDITFLQPVSYSDF